MRARTGRLLRAAAALTLAVAALPLAAGTATASQGGDDHKVTLCHRTNSENNPYVVITVDKAGVFKTGHDSHDEGGVYQPGDKARGVRWGDIIPPFTYFASPKDEGSNTVSQYPGLNYGTAGQAVLANGCQVPGPPPPPVEQPEPSGSLDGSCPDDGGDFVVTGTTSSDGATGVQFRLSVANSSPIDVPTNDDFEETITAAPGSVVTLEYRIGSGAWTSTGQTATVVDCPPTTQPVAPSGSFSATCTATGAVVDIGTLDRGTQNGGHFELVVNGTAQQVNTNTPDVAVPAGATLVLRYVARGGAVTSLQSGTAPAACPPPVVTAPSGSFTVECTTTGASVDLGTLSRGTATGGQFELVVNGTAQAVASGQQDIAVPGGASLVLRYVPATGAPTTLDSRTAPAACTTPTTPPPPTTPQPERGLNLVKSVSPTGASTVGATLTYTLVVTATGNAAQTGVTVGDYLPGYAPGTDSGTTTYVAGSASCAGTGTCTTSYDAATHRVTWGLGTMAAGTNRAVSFQVTIDAPTPAADGSIEAFDVVNTGVVSSEQVRTTPSNEVITPVAAVLGTKTGQPTTSGGSTPNSPTETSGGVLPRTGSSSLVWTLGLAGLLLLVGGGLVSLPSVRRRD